MLYLKQAGAVLMLQLGPVGWLRHSPSITNGSAAPAANAADAGGFDGNWNRLFPCHALLCYV